MCFSLLQLRGHNLSVCFAVIMVLILVWLFSFELNHMYSFSKCSLIASSGAFAIEIWACKTGMDFVTFTNTLRLVSANATVHRLMNAKQIFKVNVRTLEALLSAATVTWHGQGGVTTQNSPKKRRLWPDTSSFGSSQICSAAPRASLTAGLLPKKGFCKQQ